MSDSAHESLRLAAAQAFAEGEALRLEGRAESRSTAIRKYEQALTLWRAVGARQEEARTLRALGELHYLSGAPLKARQNWQQALQLSQAIPDQRGEGEALNGLCHVAIRRSEFREAADWCEQALTLNRAAGNQAGEAEALNNLGLLAYSRGQPRQALDYHEKALPLSRARHDRRGEALALLRLGYAWSNLGETRKAFDSHQQALALWRGLNDCQGQALTLTALGHLHSQSGEKQEALKAYFQALELFQVVGDLVEKGFVLGGLGFVYTELGEYQNGLRYYREGLRLYQDKGFRRGVATSFVVIGDVHSALGEVSQALAAYQQGLALARSLPDSHTEAHALVRIGRLYELQSNSAAALESYEQALALTRSGGDRRQEAYALNDLGRICEALGARARALEYFQQALQLNRDVEDRFGESLTLHNLARTALHRGNLSEARTQAEASLSISESLRTKVASQELRSSYFATVRQRYEFYVDLLMQLHRQRPAEGFDALALEASERARARSLLELLAEARADITAGADPGLLERERSLQQLIRDKSERQMRLGGSRQSAAEAAAITKELQELTTSYDEVRALIRAQSPRYAALVQPQPLTLAEIQQQMLDPDTLLLEYALGDERSHLWVVTPDSIASFELPARAEIEAAARRVYELLTARNQIRPQETILQRLARISRAEDEYAQAAAALCRMILAPAAAHLGSKRLLIVADGALQYVPFAALPKPEFGIRNSETGIRKPETGRKRASDLLAGSLPAAELRIPNSEFRPLIADHEIISLPSASTLAVLRRELAGRTPAPKSVAVLADPVFEVSDERVRTDVRQMLAFTGSGATNSSRVAQRQRGALSRQAARSAAAADSDLERALRSAPVRGRRGAVTRLLFSRREAEAILKTIPAEAALKAIDFAASQETATSSELSQYRIIHFATHGLLNTEQPQLSGILLSLVDEQGRAKDGFLQLHEIYNLRLPAELVVLSACQTGLGREVSGEGLVGLVRGFMYAGAARVVASLWKVDDAATAELMKRFYEEMLGRGQTPAAALRAAQISMWRQRAWQSPAAWASFVIQGEWK